MGGVGDIVLNGQLIAAIPIALAAGLIGYLQAESLRSSHEGVATVTR